MNKIEITNDQWLLADHMGAIFTFTGTTNERIAALKETIGKESRGRNPFRLIRLY